MERECGIQGDGQIGDEWRDEWSERGSRENDSGVLGVQGVCGP